MHTFAPLSASIRASLSCLDSRRLHKQSIEALQIYLLLVDAPLDDGRPRTGHRHHPVLRMWRGHLNALRHYIHEAVWLTSQRPTKQRNPDGSYRCYNNLKMRDNLIRYNIPLSQDEFRQLEGPLNHGLSTGMPWWWGREDVHRSHRRALYRKSSVLYPQFQSDDVSGGGGWGYVWP